MKNKKMLLNTAIIMIFALTASALSVFENTAFAAGNKVDLEAGFFSLASKVGTKSGTISSPGFYRVGYRRSVHPHFDIGVGYSIMFTQIVTGDSGFGLDINSTYFFLGAGSLIESTTDQSYMAYSEDIRPFVSMCFAQRNYQSLQTSYAGFGFAAGAEKNLLERLSLKLTARYNMLSAGTTSTANELTFLGGVAIEF